MGIIQRQGIKQSLVNYFAVAIAAISTVFIYPQDKATYGLARFIIDTSMMISPFIMLGYAAATIRFFPEFKDDKNHKGFLSYLIGVLALGSLIFIALAFLFKENIYGLYAEKPQLYRQFLPYIVPIAILMAFFHLFNYWSSNFQRIVVPSLYQNLIKLSLPILILLFLWNSIGLEELMNGVLLNYFIALIGIIAYVYWLGELKLKVDFNAFSASQRKKIRSFAFYNLLNGIGSTLAFRIDLFMVPTMLSFTDNGIYAIALFIGSTIAIPTNAVMQIAGPIVADSIKNNDLKHVKHLYKSSSLNLLVPGLFLFVCIIASVEDLFSIMPKSEQMIGGLMVVLFIGLAKVVDMGTSINNQIINYSKYFRFGFVSILFMAAFNISANLLLIPHYGIIGAAIATLISLTLYNLIKLVFIQWKFNMHPFNQKTIVVVLIAGIVYFLVTLLPHIENSVVSILVKSVFIGILYGPAVYYLKVSADLNRIIDQFVQRLR